MSAINQDEPTIEERGWHGHFIASNWCRFSRNTLVGYRDRKIVVSTVGNYHPNNCSGIQEIGVNRYYETMVFEAKKSGPYIDADVTKEIPDYYDTLCYVKPKDIPIEVDLLANEMHERMITKVGKALQDNNLPEPRKPSDEED
jgi:hypothetical protein